MAAWSVGAFGTCRVEKPLQAADAQGLLRFKLDPVFGYLHNPLEIAQAVRLLRGALAPPPEILWKPLHLGNPAALGPADRFDRMVAEVDMLVIELSSTRIIGFDGWQLQIHRFRELLLPHGVPEKAISALFTGGEPARRAVLERLTGEEAAFARDVVTRGQFAELEGAPLDAALAALLDLVAARPVLLVGTLGHDFRGNAIRQRYALAAAMEAAAAGRPHVGWFDPTSFIDGHGATEAMSDLGHYRPGFEPVAGRELAARLAAFGAQDALAQSLRAHRVAGARKAGTRAA